MNIVCTIFYLACVLHTSYACVCPPVTFKDIFCQSAALGKFFLIQAQVTKRTGPLYPDHMSSVMQEFYAYRRYELAVKETYRDITGLVKPVTILKAPIRKELCSISLKVGMTYVLAGRLFHNAAGEEELTTSSCQYSRRYNTEADVALPICY